MLARDREAYEEATVMKTSYQHKWLRNKKGFISLRTTQQQWSM